MIGVFNAFSSLNDENVLVTRLTLNTVIKESGNDEDFINFTEDTLYENTFYSP